MTVQSYSLRKSDLWLVLEVAGIVPPLQSHDCSSGTWQLLTLMMVTASSNHVIVICNLPSKHLTSIVNWGNCICLMTMWFTYHMIRLTTTVILLNDHDKSGHKIESGPVITHLTMSLLSGPNCDHKSRSTCTPPAESRTYSKCTCKQTTPDAKIMKQVVNCKANVVYKSCR